MCMCVRACVCVRKALWSNHVGMAHTLEDTRSNIVENVATNNEPHTDTSQYIFVLVNYWRSLITRNYGKISQL